MRNTFLVAALIMMGAVTLDVGAVERIEEPLTFKHAMNWKVNTAVSLGQLDLKKIGVEDEARVRKGLPLRVAIARKVDAAQKSDLEGEWSTIDDMSVWRLEVQAAEAKWLSFTFEDVFLPPGASLYVYDQNRSQVIGPVTDKDNKASRKLWTPLLSGQMAYIEINVPSSMKRYLSFELKSINHGYRNLKASKAEVVVGACNIDVVCPEGDDWRDEIRSVASYIFQNDNEFFTCTGNLVNNVSQDRKPYMMTASHCISTAAQAQSMVLYWNLQKTSCGGVADGSLAQNQSGATLRAAVGSNLEGPRPRDMTLVELDSTPNPDFNVYFSGWDATSTLPSSGVGIHHPNREEKRISIESGPIVLTDFLFPQERFDGTHLKIASWDQGTTEGGSSGSGFWNQDKRIVGVLSGGTASCDTPEEPDYYAHLASHYDVGSTSTTRIKAWLDPANTGITGVDGLEGCEAPQISITINPMPAEAEQAVVFTPVLTGGTNAASRTFAWDFDGDGTVDSTDASPTYTYSSSYIGNVDLTVTETQLCSGAASAAIIVEPAGGNIPPVASATASSVTADGGSAVQLDASGSTDMDGNDFTYQWAQTSGPAAGLSNSGQVMTSATMPMVATDTVVTFEVTVTDIFGGSDTDTVSVTVLGSNLAPVANVTNASVTVNEGSLVTLNASASSDPNGDTLSYMWVQTSGSTVTLNNSGNVMPTFTAPQVNSATALGFSVTATDPDGLSSSTTVTVTVNNVPPAATDSGGGGGSGAIGWPMLVFLFLMATARSARRILTGIVLVCAGMLVTACSTPDAGSMSSESTPKAVSSQAAAEPVVRLVKLGSEKNSRVITNVQHANATVEALDNRERRYEKLRPMYAYELEIEIDGESEVWKISRAGYVQKATSYELYKMDMSSLKEYMQ